MSFLLLKLAATQSKFKANKYIAIVRCDQPKQTSNIDYDTKQKPSLMIRRVMFAEVLEQFLVTPREAIVCN